jgi:hypothetical protein
VGVTNHSVTDAAHKGPLHSPAPSSAHDDEPRIYVLGYPQDLLGPIGLAYQFGYHQVLLRNIAPVPLYLLDLLIEDYLCSIAQLLYHFRDPDVVAVVAVVGGKPKATVTT